jgi:hypothetical protein
MIAAVLAVAGGLPAFGEADDSAVAERRVISDKWVLQLGSYLSDFRTDASVGSGGLIGSFIRFEDDLNVDDAKSFGRIDGFYRFNRKHAIGFGYWATNRRGRVEIDEQIEFQDFVFDVGASVGSEFDTRWVQAGWRYALLRTDKGEAGFAAGLSVYEFNLGLDGVATVDDGVNPPITEFVEARKDLVAPLPTVGFFLHFAFTPKLVFRTQAGFLDVSVQDYEGRVVDTSLLVDYFFTKNFGLGIGVSGTDIDVRRDVDDPFAVRYRQSGLLARIALAF